MAGIPIVLLSDGRSTTQRNKIRALGIQNRLHTILISEETGRSKLDTEAFKAVAPSLEGRTPIVHFGDNPTKDVGPPVELGWVPCLMLDRGDNVHSQGSEIPHSERIHLLRSMDDVKLSIC